jgi:hypothetical protein
MIRSHYRFVTGDHADGLRLTVSWGVTTRVLPTNGGAIAGDVHFDEAGFGQWIFRLPGSTS